MKTNGLQASFKALLLTLAVMSAASVTGCSERLKEEALPPLAPLAEKKAELPAPPPDIALCFKVINPKGNSMDEKVLNLKKSADAQTACGKKFVTWYEGVRAVQNGGLPPPAPSGPAVSSTAPAAQAEPPKAQAKVVPADAAATPKL